MDPKKLAEILDPNPTCSNYGCNGRKHDADLNPECVFHPGVAVFHEGYKYWDCCKRKSIHFDDFLKQVGCAKGEHNWEPRAQPVKSDIFDVEEEPDSRNVPSPKPEPELVIRPAMTIHKRPDRDAPLLEFQVERSESLTKLVEEGKLPVEEPPAVLNCQNSGCSVKEKEVDENPICYYHPGEAVFHEGLKYWSCCKKKAFEFEQFLKQKGCQEGDHRFQSDQKVDCRFDWHQTGSHVILTIYAKGYNPSTVQIKANAVRLQISFKLASAGYSKDWDLFGIIEESNCYSCLFPTKIEIKLKKAHPGYWTDFEYKNPTENNRS